MRTVCPKCRSAYAWNGTTCGHCHYSQTTTVALHLQDPASSNKQVASPDEPSTPNSVTSQPLQDPVSSNKQVVLLRLVGSVGFVLIASVIITYLSVGGLWNCVGPVSWGVLVFMTGAWVSVGGRRESNVSVGAILFMGVPLIALAGSRYFPDFWSGWCVSFGAWLIGLIVGLALTGVDLDENGAILRFLLGTFGTLALSQTALYYIATGSWWNIGGTML